MNLDPLDTCPYDPVHRILRSRMQYHLTRCSKNFVCSKKQKCPFDACHIINQVEYNYHVSICPARESVLHYKIQDPEVLLQDKLVPIQIDPVIATEENWENDAEVRSYNPLQHVIERPIVRSLIGASKAKRKQFRMDERRRIQQIENGLEQSRILEQSIKEKSKTSNQSKSSKPQSSIDAFDQENKPLRRPKNLQLNQSNLSGFDQSFNTLKQIETKNETPTVAKQTTQEDTKAKNNAKEKKSVATKTETEKKIDTDEKKNPVATTNKVPFSYASALNSSNKNISVNKNLSANEENEIKNMQQHNLPYNNNTSLNCTIDDSVIEKLSKTIEDIAMTDEGYTKITKPLDKQIEYFKQLNTSNINSKSATEKKDEKAFNSANKKFSRCAANFPDLK